MASNEDKKKYLNRYRWDIKALEEIEGEITRCRLGALPGGLNYDGMPHGSGGSSDLSDYAVKIDELLIEFKAKRERLMQDLREISHAIDAVEDPRSNIILRYRYIQLKDWGFIAEAMGYAEEYVKRNLHGKALKDFKIL